MIREGYKPLFDADVLDKFMDTSLDVFSDGSERYQRVKQLIIDWQAFMAEANESEIRQDFYDVFWMDILGYRTRARRDRNLWTLDFEQKTESSERRVDGALGYFYGDHDKKRSVQAVIELKETGIDLDHKPKGGLTPAEQAYQYASDLAGCEWIIVSNGRLFRLYNLNETRNVYEEFDVADLATLKTLDKFYTLLCADHLIAPIGESVTDKLYGKSKQTQAQINETFYQLYKGTRAQLYKHLEAHNHPRIDKNTLFDKAQKIMDRMVFIFFCEDTVEELLPAKSFKRAYDHGMDTRRTDIDPNERVWYAIRDLFVAVDKGSLILPMIHSYNGGLFRTDPVLDGLSIKNGIWDTFLTLSGYDFTSQVGVEILGYIFEKNVSNIDMIRAELTGNGDVPQYEKSQRKQEGIFYTPAHITKAIVADTVGRYLQEHPTRLETITVLDPACGSGAFLNQAHTYLSEIRRSRIDVSQHAAVLDVSVAVDNDILVENLYGVDINRVSVGVTRLSLWLKTAKKKVQLQDLDHNIKVGNSLIEDVDADKHAFVWEEQFSDIMANGGFDVVIGNPPYVRQERIKAIKPYLQHYETYKGTADLYVYFIERSLKLLKPGGYFGFIVSNQFMRADYGRRLRKWLTDNFTLVKIVKYFSDKVFRDATVEVCILVAKSVKATPDHMIEVVDYIGTEAQSSFRMSQRYLSEGTWNFESETVFDVKAKLEAKGARLKDIADLQIYRGVVTGLNDAFIIDEETKDKLIIEDQRSAEIIKPLLRGRDVHRYGYIYRNYYLINMAPALNIDIDKYPAVKTWLSSWRSQLEKRGGKTIKKSYQWFETQSTVTYWEDFEKPKIIYPDIASNHGFALDTGGYYCNNTMYFIATPYPEVLTAILNSKLGNFLATLYCNKLGESAMRYFKVFMNEIPLVLPTSDDAIQLKQLALAISDKMDQWIRAKQKVVATVMREFHLQDISRRLTNIDQIDWDGFLGELKRHKVSLSLEDRDEWASWLEKCQAAFKQLHDEIETVDHEIDRRVYGLYQLTEDEIAVIEAKVEAHAALASDDVE